MDEVFCKHSAAFATTAWPYPRHSTRLLSRRYCRRPIAFVTSRTTRRRDTPICSSNSFCPPPIEHRTQRSRNPRTPPSIPPLRRAHSWAPGSGKSRPPGESRRHRVARAGRSEPRTQSPLRRRRCCHSSCQQDQESGPNTPELSSALRLRHSSFKVKSAGVGVVCQCAVGENLDPGSTR